jgi:hypothetical protein
MRRFAAFAVVFALSEPALALDCPYESGRGSSLVVADRAESVTVNFGDWTEVCPIEIPANHPDLGFGSGWLPAMTAQCNDGKLVMPIVFVSSVEGSGDYDIVVLDGMPFYRRCEG